MPRTLRERLTYANVTATVALFLAVAVSAMMGRNLIDPGAATSSVAGTWFLAGSDNELPSCTSCEVSLPASGTGSFGSRGNSANEQLSPDVAVVASNLSVHVDIAPGAATRKFALFSHSDPSHFLTCQISGTKTTCDSGAQTLNIAPGTPLFMDVANIDNAPSTKVQFSWRATAQ